MLLALVATRALADTRLRAFAGSVAVVWIAALLFRSSLLRNVGLVGLMVIPFVAIPRRVVSRWPSLAAAALLAGSLPSRFDTSGSTAVMYGLVAFGFFEVARALRAESVEETSERLPAEFPRLFASAAERAAFIGPVRLASDVVAALSVVILAASVSSLSFSRSIRLEGLPQGVDACFLLVALAGSLLWLRRSYAPAAGAVAALGATIFAVSLQSGAMSSVALFFVPVGIVGLVVVAPRAKESAARTTRRWSKSISASGVLLGSAGFFALTTTTCGEAGLSRLTKLAAVVFAIAGAQASTKLALWARVELAAEAREP